MHRDAAHRALAGWLAFCHLLFVLVATPPALAQSDDARADDAEPPLIDFQPLSEGRRGDTQVFSARVSDDVAIESVTLRYRLSTDEPYRSVEMAPLSGTDIHTASLTVTDTDVTAIQYYIEARDTSGNRSIEGFAFDPLERRLVERRAPVAAQTPEAGTAPSSEVRADGMSTGRKVLYGVLGVVALGALGALAGGGGGDSDGGTIQSDEPGVNVRVVVDPLR